MNESANESADMTRLMHEEDIIDTLFDICDREKIGYVPASQFIQYIKNTTDYEGKAQLEFLHKVLDPEGVDALIDLKTCHAGFSNWIRNIRHSSGDGDASIKESKRLPEKTNILDDILIEENDELSEAMKECDELKHKNKILRDLNNDLQLQLEAADDASSKQNAYISELTLQISGLRQFIEQCQRENSDYVAALSHQDKIEAENCKLKELHQSSKEELSRIQQLLEQRDRESSELIRSLHHHKTMLTYTKEMLDMKDGQLVEQTKNFTEIQNYINELKKKIEDLKDEKCQLEEHLSQSNHELDRLQRMRQEQHMPDVCGSPSITSLRTELKDQLEQIPHLPSPLCERDDTHDMSDASISDVAMTSNHLNTSDPQVYVTTFSPLANVKNDGKANSLRILHKKRRERGGRLKSRICNFALTLPSLQGFIGHSIGRSGLTSTPITGGPTHAKRPNRSTTLSLSDDSHVDNIPPSHTTPQHYELKDPGQNDQMSEVPDSCSVPAVINPNVSQTMVSTDVDSNPIDEHVSIHCQNSIYTMASHFRKMREDRLLRKKQVQHHLKMPELTEMSEGNNNNNNNNNKSNNSSTNNSPVAMSQKVEFQITLDAGSVRPTDAPVDSTRSRDSQVIDKMSHIDDTKSGMQLNSKLHMADANGRSDKITRNDCGDECVNVNNNNNNVNNNSSRSDMISKYDVRFEDDDNYGDRSPPGTVIQNESLRRTLAPDELLSGDEDSRILSPAETVLDEPDDLLVNSTYSSAFPSMPPSFLENLGLMNQTDSDDNNSLDELTPEEIEEKFSSLSLAYKTDLQTLEQRLDVQRRARDRAEANVDKELSDLSDIQQSLSAGERGKILLGKLREGIQDLKQSLSRVSCDAEVLGAVEQEGRLSKAMELMITYVDHLKRKHEKEHAELDEARQLLHMNSIISGGIGPSDAFQLHKRAYSVSQTPGQKASALEMSESHKEQCPIYTEESKGDVRGVRKSSNDSLVGLTRSARRGSDSIVPAVTVKQRDSPVRQESAVEGSDGGASKAKEDEAFQRGFAQGIRAHLGRELTDLRSQQQNFSQKLDDLMDETDKLSDDDVSKASRETLTEWLSHLRPELEWQLSGEKMRATTSLCVLFLALLCALYTLLPHSSELDISTNIKYDRTPPS